MSDVKWAAEKVLEVEDLHVCIPTKSGNIFPAAGVSISVYKGESVGLVGESGSGKTVTALSVARLFAGASDIRGAIRVNGIDILSLSEAEMVKLRGALIGMIFQDPLTFLNPTMKVGSQVAEAIRLHSSLSRAQTKELVLRLLSNVGFRDNSAVAGSYPHELSGGMRQRIVISVAISNNPSLIIADEPTTALDVTTQKQIMDLLKNILAESSAGLLLITHDLGLIAEYCDRIYVMYAGQIVEQNPTAALFSKPLHPYTQGLMASVGNIGDAVPIEGEPPQLAALPRGCTFYPRCKYRMDRCEQVAPPWHAVGDGGARCWLLESDHP